MRNVFLLLFDSSSISLLKLDKQDWRDKEFKTRPALYKINQPDLLQQRKSRNCIKLFKLFSKVKWGLEEKGVWRRAGKEMGYLERNG